MQNPVGVLSNCRAWNKVKRRTGHIAERDFAAWFKAVEQERDRTVKDYLKFLSLTGLRSEEASSLKWSDVDLNEGKFCVPDTKNGDPLYLPLAKYTWQMLRLRRDLNPAETFVFTGKYGKAFRIHTSHIRRIEWASGVKFNPHDLRRTYLTVGDSLDIPLHILKRLANHRQSQDITLSYIQTNVSRLREPVEKITQKIVSLWRS
jgi:integrase